MYGPAKALLVEETKADVKVFTPDGQSLGSARSVPAMERELLCYCWPASSFGGVL